MSETLAKTLAEFAAGLTYDALPAAVRDAAMLHVVDTIGVCLAGASPREESGQVALRLGEKWKAPTGATVLGTGAVCRPEAAALLNGALAQALEMDDKHGSSLARPGSTVTPAVLAVAQANGLPLKDAITAIVAGYEVMIRLGFVAGERFLERGYHTSSLLGAFGTVAAVGCLLRHKPAEIADGLGIAGTFASGIQEATRTGSTSKILHGGWGAHSGIIALDLACAGITGPASVFEGKFGFFQCFLTPITGELDFAQAAQYRLQALPVLPVAARLHRGRQAHAGELRARRHNAGQHRADFLPIGGTRPHSGHRTEAQQARPAASA
jgi:2-methylcitrate dehydratase PrpD